jgi:tetratricopeptide (TPR) repeat protein
MGGLVPRGSRPPHAGRRVAGFLIFGLGVAGTAADLPDPLAPLDAAIAGAEDRLRASDLEAAESRYREALFEGWLVTATLEALERRVPQASEALRNAALFRVETKAALRALGTAQLRMGEAASAVETFEALAAKDPRDGGAHRLLARALAFTGQAGPAAQKLAEAEGLLGEDAELAFLVATDYLWLKRIPDAERLFARVLEARPIAPTHVLVGRAYRDAGEYDRARAALQAALARDSGVRRAHYYLGMVVLADARTGPDRLDRAMAEFREELRLAPDDGPANDQLGLALLEAGRPAEALPALESAVRAQPRPLHLFHLGRCLLALDRPVDAAGALRRALETAEEHGGSGDEIAKIHYQLGLALRKLGSEAEAARHLGEARRLAVPAGDPTGSPAPPDATGAAGEEASPLAELPLFKRQGLKRRAAAGLVRAYFNLGVLQVQGRRSAPAAERFSRAAAFFERAAELDPDFPQLQASLGVAYFNAREFAKATGPLDRAVAAAPDDRGLARMLATSWLNTGAWDKAAALLEKDPDRETDASLAFAFGLALLRSGHAARAEEVLAGAARLQGDSSELLVLLGQAHAEQGEHEEAVRALEKALALDPHDAEARRTLDGVLGRGAGRRP